MNKKFTGVPDEQDERLLLLLLLLLNGKEA